MKIHRIKGYIQSLYLAEYSDKLLLLDGGCYCDFPIIKKYIEDKLNRDFSDLKLVLISHTHPDHIGGAWRYKKSGIKVACKEGMDNWYHGSGGLKNYWVDIILTWYVAKKMKRPFRNIIFKRRIEPDFFLVNNKPVPGFNDWSVLDTPGHTDSDLSFYHEQSEQAYIGDNIIKLREKFIIPHPVSFPKLYKESVLSYKNRKISNFLLAHGGESVITHDELNDIANRVRPVVIDNSDILKQVIRNFKKKRK